MVSLEQNLADKRNFLKTKLTLMIILHLCLKKNLFLELFRVSNIEHDSAILYELSADNTFLSLAMTHRCKYAQVLENGT